MTAKTVVAVASVAIALGSAGCMSFIEVPVETPIHAKLDTTSYQRVLVAGFLGGGTKAIDTSAETSRLLRSQLRSKSTLKVIDADVLQLVNEVDKRRTTPLPATGDNGPDEPKIKNEKDLAEYESILSDVPYWKKVGHRSPSAASTPTRRAIR
jgi:hypothetical protein